MEIVTYKRYIDQVHEEFGHVDKKSIESIVRYGLAIMTKMRRGDHDILLNNNREKIFYYLGQVSKNDEHRDYISKKKVRSKYRLLYKLKKTEYSGYYYFGLSEPDYQLHLKGEVIPMVILFKVERELPLYKIAKHFFRVKMDEQKKWSIIEENYETNSAEYIQQWTSDGSESVDNT